MCFDDACGGDVDGSDEFNGSIVPLLLLLLVSVVVTESDCCNNFDELPEFANDCIGITCDGDPSRIRVLLSNPSPSNSSSTSVIDSHDPIPLKLVCEDAAVFIPANPPIPISPCTFGIGNGVGSVEDDPVLADKRAPAAMAALSASTFSGTSCRGVCSNGKGASGTA